MSKESKLAKELAGQLGPNGWLTEGIDSYCQDWLRRYACEPLGVARPKNADQVAATIRSAQKYSVPVTPQGGNTSLCGGAVPAWPGQIVLSMSRMNKVERLDVSNHCLIVQSGCVLGTIHEVLAKEDVMFPMHLGSEGSAQIGGLIATNAGGNHAFRYGMMSDLVLGLEVVLPDGQIWDGMRYVIKDNAGYQLRKLFCGSEGTLGVITRAALKLFPRPRAQVAALVSVGDFAACVSVATRLFRQYCEWVSAVEFFSDIGLGFVLQHVPNCSFPLDSRAAAYVIIELSSTSSLVSLAEVLEELLLELFESKVILDGVVASNDRQQASFWRLRDEMPQGQLMEGPQIKHDISVPIAEVANFIDLVTPQLYRIVQGVRINPFGHLGDGNIHFNLSPPLGQAGFAGKEDELSATIYRQAEKMGGSFAAEHGVGRTKIGHANMMRLPVERQLMVQVKQAMDGSKMLNPGVINSDNA